jgi:hypothetical protein
MAAIATIIRNIFNMIAHHLNFLGKNNFCKTRHKYYVCVLLFIYANNMQNQKVAATHCEIARISDGYGCHRAGTAMQSD